MERRKKLFMLVYKESFLSNFDQFYSHFWKTVSTNSSRNDLIFMGSNEMNEVLREIYKDEVKTYEKLSSEYLT